MFDRKSMYKFDGLRMNEDTPFPSWGDPLCFTCKGDGWEVHESEEYDEEYGMHSRTRFVWCPSCAVPSPEEKPICHERLAGVACVFRALGNTVEEIPETKEDLEVLN